MFRKFYPAEMAESSYSIDYESLYAQGYRGIIYDIDNTLVEHGADANEEVIELFRRLCGMGFRICLLSNNKAPRVRRFYHGVKIKGVKLHYIFDAHKPAKKNYRKAMLLMRTTKKTTLFVGDQLFTDVYGANRVGIRSFLVKPINKKEEIQIVFKRRLERIVLHFYKKERIGRLKQTNLVLIGFMGCGKSSVGQYLAQKCGFTFVDTDALIEERAGCKIREIFQEKGEEYFRDMETDVLSELVRTAKRQVIATGGGMPVREKNQKLLRKLGFVVYLSVTPETVLERLQGDTTRPLLQKASKEDELRRLLTERKFVYQMTAHKVVAVDGKTIPEIAAEIHDSI